MDEHFDEVRVLPTHDARFQKKETQPTFCLNIV